MPKSNLRGKLIAIHSTSPAFLQRAAVVAFLSLLFFFATLIAFYLFKSLVLFLLSSAFLVLYIFTMIGWWLQKKNAVSIYENGVVFKGNMLAWDEISGAELGPDGSLVITEKDGGTVAIPAAVAATDRIHAFILDHIP